MGPHRGAEPARQPRPTPPYYEVEPTFRYTVSGTEYYGRIMAFQPPRYDSLDQARAVVLARYLVGGPVTVAYDPTQPALSVLDTSRADWSILRPWQAGCWGLSALSLILAATALLPRRAAPRDRPANPPTPR